MLHELGHGWQYHTGRFAELEADLAPWGFTGTLALEAGADCIAAVGGAKTDHD